MAFGRRTMGIRQYDSPTTSAVDIALPSFGYAVELRLALEIKRFSQSVKSFDSGVEYDQRRCPFKIQATENQVYLLKNTLDREHRNTHSKFVLTLARGSGFFPAGPDKGDSGEFVFSFLENINFSAMKLNPYGLFDVEFKILIHEAPNPAVSLAKKDLGGKFSFGNVKELSDPQINPTQEFGSKRQATQGGEVFTTWTPTDEFHSDLIIRTTTDKMAALAQYLQAVRGNTFSVYPGRKYWMWGGQGSEWQGSAGERVRLLDPNFIMTHTGFNLWTVPVQLWQEAERREFEPVEPPELLPEPSVDTFTDERDGQVYRIVKMPDGRWWMAENLNYDVGDGSRVYDTDPLNAEKYGRLYDWESAKRAAPDGWHLPTRTEWQSLIDASGGDAIAGKKLKAATGWAGGGNGTDDYGFAALPGGYYVPP
ncbi:MAG: hypothetical protein LBH93_00100, partial [Chitinispirillales bacterium]|nr:hypothetical protein [Chitinispirillales bacterium]